MPPCPFLNKEGQERGLLSQRIILTHSEIFTLFSNFSTIILINVVYHINEFVLHSESSTPPYCGLNGTPLTL